MNQTRQLLKMYNPIRNISEFNYNYIGKNQIKISRVSKIIVLMIYFSMFIVVLIIYSLLRLYEKWFMKSQQGEQDEK